MSRNEFLAKLKEALEMDLSSQKVEEQVAFYHQYINEEIGKGRTEAEVLEELGDPWVIARNILSTEGVSDRGNYVHENLKRRIYDAIFRIVPEGFKIMKDISRDDIVSVIATDELIKDEWVEKAEGYIVELNTPKTWD